MDGYAVSARIGEVRPGRPPTRRWWDGELRTDSGETAIETTATDAPSVRSRLAGWWSGVSIDWRETTFYLFDPESWR